MHTSMKVNGYALGHDEQSIDLVVALCNWDIPPRKLTLPELKHLAKLGRGFLIQAIDGLHTKMEETSPAFELALQIHDLREELTRARILIVTTALAREDPLPDETIDGIAVSYQVWDIERIFRAVSSGHKREPIVIDFRDFGSSIPCLAAEDGAGRAGQLPDPDDAHRVVAVDAVQPAHNRDVRRIEQLVICIVRERGGEIRWQ